MSNPFWKPCCPPFPIVEAGVGDDPTMPDGEGYRLTFYAWDAQRDTGILASVGETIYSPGFIPESADDLALHCSRCGKAAVFAE